MAASPALAASPSSQLTLSTAQRSVGNYFFSYGNACYKWYLPSPVDAGVLTLVMSGSSIF
jgi:hypothetical protein